MEVFKFHTQNIYMQNTLVSIHKHGALWSANWVIARLQNIARVTRSRFVRMRTNSHVFSCRRTDGRWRTVKVRALKLSLFMLF